MTNTHNQINKLWYKPSYVGFTKSPFVKQVFEEKDSEDFLRTGAYLIAEARKLSEKLIPWDERRRFEILANPRLENIHISLGSEYLIKGVFLKKGYAVNKVSEGIRGLSHPLRLSGNKGKLNPFKVEEMDYAINHLPRMINFSEFDNKQKSDEEKMKKNLKGQRLKGITRMTVPYPTAKQLLEYLHFKRNYSLHRPFIAPEFRGTTKQLFELMDYIAQKGTGKSIEILSNLRDA